MEPSTVNSNQEKFYAPSAQTERAYSSNIAISRDGKWMGYGVGNVIALRFLDDFKTCKVFTGHKNKTSAVSFSPSGNYVASGDILGNVLIWTLDKLTVKKELNNLLTGKIFGLDWDESSQMLLVFGDGKKAQGKCVTWENGSVVGELGTHTKLALSGDFRKAEPHRILTGSEDFSINLNEGSPFSLKKTLREHKNFVSSVKFSPDSSKFVSVSFDKKIVIYDAVEGDVLFTLTEDKAAGNHTMAIIGVCWINDSLIATCSLDKTLKVWDINEKSLKYTLFPKDKSILGVPEICCGINSNGKYLICISLSGVQNFWEISTLEDAKLPDKVIDGHQNYIAGIVQGKQKNVTISGDTGGKVIVWKGDENEYIRTLIKHEFGITSMALSSDENSVVFLIYDGSVVSVDTDTGNLKYKIKLKGEPRKIVSSNNDPNLVYILFSNSVYLLKDGQVIKQLDFKYQARALDINEPLNEIYVGAVDCNIYVYSNSLELTNTIKLHKNEVSAIKVSHDGTQVASGDSSKNILLWDASTKQLIHKKFLAHKAKIFALDWSPDDSLLVSCSLDKTVNLWSLAEQTKLKTFSEMDIEVLQNLIFVNEKEIICGGYSIALRRFSI